MTIGGLTWDTQGQHYYYTGIDAVALYVWNEGINPDGTTTTPTGWFGAPIEWNGVTAVNESPSGAESNKLYADNLEYLNLLSKEEFGVTLECYQTPSDKNGVKGFDWCDGVIKRNHIKVRGQARKQFGLVYRVLKGSDTVEAGGKVKSSSNGNGYIYHIVYGCKASPSSRDFATVNDSPEAQTFSYEITTTAITGNTSTFPTKSGNTVFNAVAHIEIDGSLLSDDTSATPANGSLQKLEQVLFGTSSTPLTRMPTPKEIATAIGYTSN